MHWLFSEKQFVNKFNKLLTKFGKQLRSLRIEKDLRLKDMADELGVTVAYLSAVENGKRAVPDSWVERISKEYDLSDQEVISMQKAAYENKKDIKINLENTKECEAEEID
ncbi:helix-turn-helix transcriptional regulator [Lachnospiraceae bacterium 56-18]|jgi:transcriptional regulator with XRE-family HTH domain